MTSDLKERAAVVEWLRGMHWTSLNYKAAQTFAKAIEEGAHLATPSCPRCGHTTDSEIHAFGCKEITP